MPRGKYTDAEILEIATQPDITYVKGKDPKRFYIHAERNDLRIEDLKRQGYRIEGEEDGATPGSSAAVQSDGTSKVVNLPGHILMSRPLELHKKVMEHKRNRFENMAKREEEEAMEKVKKELDKMGVSSKLKKRVTSVNRDFDEDLVKTY